MNEAIIIYALTIFIQFLFSRIIQFKKIKESSIYNVLQGVYLSVAAITAYFFFFIPMFLIILGPHWELALIFGAMYIFHIWSLFRFS